MIKKKIKTSEVKKKSVKKNINSKSLISKKKSIPHSFFFCHKKLLLYSTFFVVILFLVITLIVKINEPSVLEHFLEDSSSNRPTLFAIESRSCGVCNTQELVYGLKDKVFKNLEVKTIFNSKEFDDLILASKTKTIPLVFFNKEIKEYNEWERIKTAFYEFTFEKEIYYAIESKFLLSPKEILNSNYLLKKDFLTIGKKKSKNTVYIVTDYSSQFLSAMEGNKDYLPVLLKINKDFEPIIPKLMNNFVETRQTNIKYINFLPKDTKENIILAHKAAECSNEVNFFKEYKNLLLLNQSEWLGSLETRKIFQSEFTQKLDLDSEKFTLCLDKDFSEKFNIQYELLSSLGITGSPTIIVNNVILSGIPKYDLVSLLLEEKLK